MQPSSYWKEKRSLEQGSWSQLLSSPEEARCKGVPSSGQMEILRKQQYLETVNKLGITKAIESKDESKDEN